MEKSWFGKLFSPAHKSEPPTTPLAVNETDAETQFILGLKFASGAGVAQDYAQAAAWYRKAASQNHGLAQFNLGTMYARGQGVARDDAESVRWFSRAANLGDAGAQFNMGRTCQRASMDGLPASAPESRIEAYKWYQLAAAQGYQNAADAYATLTVKMTREDVTEANDRIAHFVSTHATKPHLA